jgi:hypothetical protein
MKHGLVIALMALMTMGCLGKSGDTGGETHWQKGWLRGCVSSTECGDGLSCIGNLCTLECTDDKRCDAFGAGECLAHAGGKACLLPERIGCRKAALECNDSHDGWFCFAGAEDACRRPISVCDAGQWLDGELDTCRQVVATSSPLQSSSKLEVVYGGVPQALDLLFVVDASTSMTTELTRLATAMPELLDALDAFGMTNLRVAATSVDAACAPGANAPASSGRLNDTPAAAWPPVAQYRLNHPCTEDADCAQAACENLGECEHEGLWICRTASVQACIDNPNGTTNTTCKRLCTEDTECQDLFADTRATCQRPSENPNDWGCVVQPPTSDCPPTIDSIIASNLVETSHCAVSIPVHQERCFAYEQGLASSRLALDPSGPNAAQATNFVRPGAALAVVYLSDEDDCSSSTPLDEADYNTCGLLADTNSGGPLEPVSNYVSFLRSLKPEGQVHVAAIVGSSLATDAAGIAADNAAYLASKSDSQTCHQQTAICQSLDSSADWGSRYLELVAAFGPDGHSENICRPEELEAMFARTGQAIRRSLQRICVPVETFDGLTVTRTRADVETPLTLGEGVDGYLQIDGAAECPTGLAITPAAAPQPGDRLIIAR